MVSWARSNAEQTESVKDPSRVLSLDADLSLFVAFALALGQPLLDLLGRNPEFFVARDSGPVEILIVGLTLTLGIPIAMVALRRVAAWIAVPLGRIIHVVMLGGLLAVLALHLLKETPGFSQLPAALLLVLASGLGGVGVWAYFSIRDVRKVVRFAAILPVAVLVFFCFFSESSALLNEAAFAASPTQVKRDAPVVMVIFDELPLTSLLDAEGGIDARNFPNFARLGERSTWYSNATTVHTKSSFAVPALLSGTYPAEGQLPVVGDYPRNIFTMLSDRSVTAFEPITRLCPAEVCEDTGPRPDLWMQAGSLASDLRLVSLHLVAPDELTEGLPPVNETWGGFDQAPDDHSEEAMRQREIVETVNQNDHRAIFHEFVDSLERGRSRFFFLHSLLPHRPWRYLPNGQVYGFLNTPLTKPDSRVWVEDEWVVAQAQQRHLLQTAYVDQLLGSLMDRLEHLGTFDETLLVVTSDHGSSFVPGTGQRAAGESSLGDVAPVPLFVKLPGQDVGTESRLPAETIDILPTIADALGARLPRKEIDGFSLLNGDAAVRDSKRVLTGEIESFAADGKEKLDSIRRKLSLFGLANGVVDPYALTPPGARAFLDKEVRTTVVGAPFPGNVSTQSHRAYENVDLDEDPLPAALFKGQLVAEERLEREAVIAIAVDGAIAAITRTYGREAQSASFHALIPKRALHEGVNDVRLFVIERGSLRPLAID
jgi:hypothetical protein